MSIFRRGTKMLELIELVFQQQRETAVLNARLGEVLEEVRVKTLRIVALEQEVAMLRSGILTARPPHGAKPGDVRG